MNSATYTPTLNRLFGLHPAIVSENPAGGNCFRVDIQENDNAYRILAELPGIDKKNVSIGVEDNVLSISAEFAADEAQDGKTLRRERLNGKLLRQFRLSADMQADGISAELKNGVLTVTLPKGDNKRQHKIAIA